MTSDTTATQGYLDRAVGAVRLYSSGSARCSVRLLPPRAEFALRFGADHTTAAIWPLIVDGLLTMATVELKTGNHHCASGRWAAWLAFALGICLSLCANIAAAPELSVLAVAVAACPPLALLLAVELLNRALTRHHAETAGETMETAETGDETGPVVHLSAIPE